MTDFDDSAPIPRYSDLRRHYYGDGNEPMDDTTERLFDALGIDKRRHLRARIQYLIDLAVQDAYDNCDNS